MGSSFTIYEDEIQRKAMEAAGFVDIQSFEYKVNVTLLERQQELTVYDRPLLEDGQKIQQ